MPTQVHLEEAVLGLDEALRAEQVVRVVGVDLGDALPVTQDRHATGQARHLELSVGGREGPAHPRDADDRGDHQENDNESGQRHGNAAGKNDAGHPARLGHTASERT